jgi:protein TonB
MAPYRLPGTAQGVTVLTYYQAGSRQPVASETLHKNPEKTKATPLPVPVPSLPKLAPPQDAGSQAGLENSAQSGLGEGDISIALETYFPYPAPDLSHLAHGTKGDVILDAVVDEEGKISKLTLVHGLGSPVDEEVIATVQQWRYTPAKRQGVPIASERELHFHYERG